MSWWQPKSARRSVIKLMYCMIDNANTAAIERWPLPVILMCPSSSRRMLEDNVMKSYYIKPKQMPRTVTCNLNNDKQYSWFSSPPPMCSDAFFKFVYIHPLRMKLRRDTVHNSPISRFVAWNRLPEKENYTVSFLGRVIFCHEK